MTPNRRIIAQAVHRAVSFGAVGFLMIHIVTEIIAGRSHPVDAVVPFLGERRALYLGMGTIASDLFLLVLVTGIMRGRFATLRPTWMWRALHAVAYVAWPLGILHGLLDGRTAKPYVDWGYGACVAAVGLALITRLVVAARVQETASSPVPAAPPWLSAGGAGTWLPGGSVTQIEPARAYPRAVARPPLALPPGPADGMATPPRGMPVPPGSRSTPPRGMPVPPPGMPTPPRGMPVPPGSRSVPPGGMPTPPRGMPVPPGSRSVPPGGMPVPPRGDAGASGQQVRASGRHADASAGHACAAAWHVSAPAWHAPGPRPAPPPSPPRQAIGMPAHPQYAAGDHDYPGPGDPADYYYGPDDEDEDPEWADAGYLDGEYLDADDDDSDEFAEDDDPEWADEEDHGPGPGWGYPHADASRPGWTR